MSKPRDVKDMMVVLSKHKQELLDQYHVQKIGIFGSFARNEATSVSDVDILVELASSVCRVSAVRCCGGHVNGVGERGGRRESRRHNDCRQSSQACEFRQFGGNYGHFHVRFHIRFAVLEASLSASGGTQKDNRTLGQQVGLRHLQHPATKPHPASTAIIAARLRMFM